MTENGSLTVSNVSFAYPDGRSVLSNLSLHIEAQERVAVVGPNGAGKTTLSLLLNGLLNPLSGTIEIGGLTLGPDTVGEVRRRVGMVFQNPDDQLFMPTVEQDVAFGPANLGLTGAARQRRVAAALDSVGAADLRTRVPHHLSGGEKRRVAVATVLAMEPDMLVLDEPTSGLDPGGRRELINLLNQLPHTQFIITHDLPFAAELCPRTVIIDGGTVVADGGTHELLQDRALLAQHRLELPYGFRPERND